MSHSAYLNKYLTLSAFFFSTTLTSCNEVIPAVGADNNQYSINIKNNTREPFDLLPDPSDRDWGVTPVYLKSDSFQGAVINDKSSSNIWVIEFFSRACGACQHIAPIYSAAAKSAFFKSKGLVKFGAFDCIDDIQFCLDRGVRHVPFFVKFQGGLSDLRDDIFLPDLISFIDSVVDEAVQHYGSELKQIKVEKPLENANMWDISMVNQHPFGNMTVESENRSSAIDRLHDGALGVLDTLLFESQMLDASDVVQLSKFKEMMNLLEICSPSSELQGLFSEINNHVGGFFPSQQESFKPFSDIVMKFISAKDQIFFSEGETLSLNFSSGFLSLGNSRFCTTASCALWQFLHGVSFSPLTNPKCSVSSAMTLIFYLVSSMSCMPCKQHFVKSFNNCGLGRCDSDGNPVQSVKEMVLWLWRMHEAVTRYNIGKSFADAPVAPSDFHWWPYKEVCKECFEDRGLINNDALYNELQRVYLVAKSEISSLLLL